MADPFGKGTPVDGDFDSDDNPFDARLIPTDHVAKVVPGYHPRIKVRTSDHWPSLYIIFDKIRGYKVAESSTLELRPGARESCEGGIRRPVLLGYA